MKILIIYDSVFGNTEKIAQAMYEALGSLIQTDVHILRVKDVMIEHISNLNVLIVGSPTRAFSPTPSINRLLRSIPKHGLKGVKVAAFDTRISIDDVNSRILPPLVKLFGYAAKPIAEKLKKKEGELTLPPEGFIVEDTEGPLKENELKRAADWVKQIMAPG